MSEKEKSIGALWNKGNYFTGNIELVEGQKISVVVFKNTYKKAGDNQPDWRILKAKPKQIPSNKPTDDINQEEIPF